MFVDPNWFVFGQKSGKNSQDVPPKPMAAPEPKAHQARWFLSAKNIKKHGGPIGLMWYSDG